MNLKHIHECLHVQAVASEIVYFYEEGWEERIKEATEGLKAGDGEKNGGTWWRHNHFKDF